GKTTCRKNPAGSTLPAHVEEKEFIRMVATLRRTVLLIMLALALLAGLVGWTLHMEVAFPTHPNAPIHSSHIQTAYVCPPPPFNCQG
ncbi:MAG: hypothetical protein ACJ795_06265, partial [Ktedonobacteraceae bacterium]